MVFIGKGKIFNHESFFNWKSARIPGFDILKNRKIQNWKIKNACSEMLALSVLESFCVCANFEEFFKATEKFGEIKRWSHEDNN